MSMKRVKIVGVRPLYIVTTPDEPPRISRELFYQKPGTETVVTYDPSAPGTRLRRRRHGPRLFAGSTRFSTTNGRPLNSPDYGLRRATRADTVEYEKLSAEIKLLDDQRQRLLVQAWRRGTAPHVNESTNFHHKNR